jgi:hypothetical protein
MTWTTRLVMLLYLAVYFLAVWVGADALHDGHALTATALFSASAGLLLALRRECLHAATLWQVAAAYHRLKALDPHDLYVIALEAGSAQPPGCRCETWWTSLGAEHDPQCPALSPKDTW